jgi:hypothetical protein
MDATFVTSGNEGERAPSATRSPAVMVAAA